MKKVLVLILVISILFVFTGCGKSEAAKKADEMILAITEITLESEEKLNAVQMYYDTLSEKEKEEVENYALFINYQKQFTALQEEQLTEFEKHFFDILVTNLKESFFEPAKVRLLEVGDYNDYTKYAGAEYDNIEPLRDLQGPDTIVIRLQGENKVGGTLNHYYRVVLKTGDNPKRTRFLTGTLYNGTEGEIEELEDSYNLLEDASELIDIPKINKALKEYWTEMGLD